MISFFTITSLTISLAFIFLNTLGSENEGDKLTKMTTNFTILDKVIFLIGICEMIFLLLKIKADGF